MTGASLPWLAEALFASTILMLLVLAVRRPFAAQFGPRVAYALWLLPVARLALPPLPEGVASVLGGGLVPAAAPVTPVAIGMLPPQAGVLPLDMPFAAPVAETAAVAIDWAAILLALWAVGAAVHFGWQLLRYRRFIGAAWARGQLLTRDCGISVWTTPAVDGPMAAGVIDRTILLPADFAARYSRPEQRLAIAHEVAHHVRGDLVANLAALLALSLHWFNPIAHRAYRAFRADQELACDATVLAEEPAALRHAYATAIVKSACVRAPAAACALNHAGEIKRRLRVMGGRITLWRSIAGGAIAGVAIGAGLIATASTSQATAPATRVERVRAPAFVPGPPALAELGLPPVAPVPAPAPMPDEPFAELPPEPPVPGWNADEVAEWAAEARAEAQEHRAAAAEARREAAAAMAAIDVPAVVRASLREARRELEGTCGRRGVTPPAVADDHAAIGALVTACVDPDAIRAEVHAELAEARAEIMRSHDLHARERAAALRAIDRERARLRHGRD